MGASGIGDCANTGCGQQWTRCGMTPNVGAMIPGVRWVKDGPAAERGAGKLIVRMEDWLSKALPDGSKVTRSTVVAGSGPHWVADSLEHARTASRYLYQQGVGGKVVGVYEGPESMWKFHIREGVDKETGMPAQVHAVDFDSAMNFHHPRPVSFG